MPPRGSQTDPRVPTAQGCDARCQAHTGEPRHRAQTSSAGRDLGQPRAAAPPAGPYCGTPCLLSPSPDPPPRLDGHPSKHATPPACDRDSSATCRHPHEGVGRIGLNRPAPTPQNTAVHSGAVAAVAELLTVPSWNQALNHGIKERRRSAVPGTIALPSGASLTGTMGGLRRRRFGNIDERPRLEDPGEPLRLLGGRPRVQVATSRRELPVTHRRLDHHQVDAGGG